MADQSEIVEAFKKALEEHEGAYTPEHRSHHDYVSRLIDRDERRDQFRQKVKQQVIGWGVITFLSGVGLAAYQLFELWIKRVGGH